MSSNEVLQRPRGRRGVDRRHRDPVPPAHAGLGDARDGRGKGCPDPADGVLLPGGGRPCHDHVGPSRGCIAHVQPDDRRPGGRARSQRARLTPSASRWPSRSPSFGSPSRPPTRPTGRSASTSASSAPCSSCRPPLRHRPPPGRARAALRPVRRHMRPARGFQPLGRVTTARTAAGAGSGLVAAHA